jgi:hypothetical protein
MLDAIRHSARGHALFGALVLIVLAMRVVVPSGFMPTQTMHGVAITLCTGQGAINVTVDRDRLPGHPADHDPVDQKSGDNQHCAFAGAAVPLLADAIASPVLPAWQTAFGPIAFAVRTGWIARLAAPPPPSSGPPAAA